ncbi:major capsid protein [Thioclava sp. F36-7]|uniref:major capsid protein n=1 Tax=Thioclava sp. F36-7 TaxID=1915317 RepID=UPI0009978C01|nr:major capsid protein [Thioclava sp. F36-7]OOY07429.1 hypothetical protein BMI89_17995 [Thioclava sp. F36-7]
MLDNAMFSGDAFTLSALTDLVNDIPYVPSRLDELKIFEPKMLSTTSISIERKKGKIQLIPPTQRGAPGVTIQHGSRDIVTDVKIPHFEINDALLAEEVQNKRAPGQTGQLTTVQEKTVEKLIDAKQNLAATAELARMGAVKGIITYADGSQLNLYDLLGVTASPITYLDLAATSPVDGALRRACANIVRDLMDLLGALPMKGVHALCGDNFFDLLIMHPEVRETYKGWPEARILREGYAGDKKGAYATFEFGGIVFENYRGSPDLPGFIGLNECRVFPMGVPGLFQTAYAPADYMETVNTEAQALYVKPTPWTNSKGISLDTQTNQLNFCTRPECLLELSSEADPAP